MRLILASGSPRRKEIMTRLGYTFEIIKAEGEEITTKTKPAEIVEELSMAKADEVAKRTGNDAVILAADTIVAVDDTILGKPIDREDAFRMIKSFQGRSHQVYTGVTIIGAGRKITFSETTGVYVKPMTDQQIRDYVAKGESDDKAGAYGIQGEFRQYIDHFEGDYDNVVGLPATRVDEELKKLGLM